MSYTKTKEALLESGLSCDLLFQATPVGISLATLEGLILETNDSFRQMIGHTLKELVESRLNDLYERQEDHTAFMDHLKREGVVRGLVVRLKRKDGSAFDAKLNAAKLLLHERGVVFIVIEDLSEVRERESQLLHSQKMEAIGRLTGGVAHDFNNVITSIMGYTDLMLGNMGSDDPLRSNLEKIKKAVERASSMTRRLLAFSRRQMLQPKILNINEEIAEVENMLTHTIGEDIELTTDLESELENILIDPGQLEQVIMNLAVNARDAMPHGGKLAIETANVALDEYYARKHGVHPKPGSYVKLAVTDTGTGMDRWTQSKVFDPFFTTKEKGRGTGLGLSTIFGIVKQSGGYIWVYSEPGEGTTFKIYFPKAEVKAAPERSVNPPQKQLHGSEAVLVVEDDDTVSELVKRILEEYGYNTLVARDGHEAIELSECQQGEIHLLLADVVLPDMNGKELASRLLEKQPEMKVLYMSGYTDSFIARRKGVPNKGSTFIEKPFLPVSLARKVREVLDG